MQIEAEYIKAGSQLMVIFYYQLIRCLGYKTPKNGEICRSVFPKAQDDILKYLVAVTAEGRN